ncbi:MAG: tRNA adenosine(34) deaminase TadA [Pseudomonadales bacterium]
MNRQADASTAASAELTTAADTRWMARALQLAGQAAACGEVPVGAVLVSADGECLGEGYNRPIGTHDPTAHAEIVALRAAATRVGNYRLPGSTLYVTLEPCMMCCGALVHARIARLVYGASEPKAGAVASNFRVLEDPKLNHRVVTEGGILGERSTALLQAFFAARRMRNRPPSGTQQAEGSTDVE